MTTHTGDAAAMPDITENDWPASGSPAFLQRPLHRIWLLDQARSLFAFFQPAALNPAGGFFGLDDQGAPLPPLGSRGQVRSLHEATRMVHCFAMAHLLGLPGADRMVEHGMDFTWTRHRDTGDGGYFWGVDDVGPVNDTKQAYGHAFVLLAASSAKVIGHPDADRHDRRCHRRPA